MGFDIDKALTYMVEREGSDLHIKVDSPPVARVHGDLWALKDAGNLTSSDTEGALHSIAEIGFRHGLRISVVSLADRLFFGFNADPDLVPDLEEMGAGVEIEAAALIAAAG